MQNTNTPHMAYILKFPQLSTVSEFFFFIVFSLLLNCKTKDKHFFSYSFKIKSIMAVAMLFFSPNE